MLKKFLLGFGLILAVLVVVEVVALLVMKSSVARYASYWKTRAAEPKQVGEFIYVALGDSTAQGIGATSPARGYVGLIATRIEQETGKKVKVINFSATGAKLSDVLDRQLPAMKLLPEYQAGTIDLVTVEIGANNLTTYDEASFRSDYSRILTQLPADKSVVSDMPYFNGIVNVHGNDVAASRIISDLTAQNDKYDIPVARLYDELHDRHSLRIYAADYFHPSNYGYGIWFDAFWPEIRPIIESSVENDISNR